MLEAYQDGRLDSHHSIAAYRASNTVRRRTVALDSV